MDGTPLNMKSMLTSYTLSLAAFIAISGCDLPALEFPRPVRSGSQPGSLSMTLWGDQFPSLPRVLA